MQIIAESGGSKTDWRFLHHDGSITQHASSGMNPNYTNNKELLELLKLQLNITINEAVETIYFYGAGCNTPDNIESISDVLNAFFKPTAGVIVFHDMLAAARSCCGSKKGIVCILGTGSNACIYNGQEITNHLPNLGYVLGDEGSGAHLGKLLLKDYFEGKTPLALNEQFKLSFPALDREQLIHSLYRKNQPNKFLASFFPFIMANQNIPYCQNLLIMAFSSFVERVKLAFPEDHDLPIHFVGGVAFHANSVLRKVVHNHKLNVALIVESPIAGLTLYHQKK